MVEETLPEEKEATDTTTPSQAPAGPPPVVRLEQRPLHDRVLEWLGEIVIVFVGVYAAFLLNAWQAQRLDRSHHLQILQSLDEELSDSVQQAREVVTRNQKTFDEFQRALAAGEMPGLHIIAFASDYDPADDVALSQAGADHLLNFKTVEALKRVSSIERQGLMMLRNRQQLSYELVAPRLDDPKETFYDPQTRQLKPMFAWYATAQQEASQFARDYLTAAEELLAQVQAERTALQ